MSATQGTQIDTGAAVAALGRADSLIVEICNSATKLRDSVKNINNIFAAPTADAPINTKYKSVYHAFDSSMPKLITELHDLHVKMLESINASSKAAGSTKTINWSTATWSKFDSVFLKATAGIESFQKLYSEIQSFDGLVSNYVNTCNDVINSYKRLYSIALEGSNNVLYDNAHNAAEKIRIYTENISASLKEFSQKFIGEIKVIEHNANDSNDETVELLNKMSETLNATPFKLLKATDLPTD